MRNLRYSKFSEIDISDSFFDSLKSDYPDFIVWFKKKSDQDEKAYLFEEKGIQGFLYLKIEIGAILDVTPPLPEGKHLKVGTMKINAHGTKLGQRFVKKIVDTAIDQSVDDIYVTVFKKHEMLINILKKYGFKEYAIKKSIGGEEIVLVKSLIKDSGDILLNYPMISKDNASCYLLAIYPEYHTKFLPDSKLVTESFDIVKDVSHANSIHKVFISGLSSTNKLKRGDILVMYRTTDIVGKARFRSVATSICVVEEVRKIKTFDTERKFFNYVKPYSVFKNKELNEIYSTKGRHNIIKFTYNVALTKRIIRKNLIEQVGLPGSPCRWDFLSLTSAQLERIVSLGQINESYFIN